MPVQDLSVDELLTDEELRELLGVSRTTLWRLRKYEGLPYGRVGRACRYRKLEVVRWISERPEVRSQLTLNLADDTTE